MYRNNTTRYYYYTRGATRDKATSVSLVFGLFFLSLSLSLDIRMAHSCHDSLRRRRSVSPMYIYIIYTLNTYIWLVYSDVFFDDIPTGRDDVTRPTTTTSK